MPAVRSSSPRSSPPAATRLDPHANVTAAILVQLETADPASWTPPWHGADPLPRNALTSRRYRGINVLALWCAAQVNGYADPRWATYQQWAAHGAQVRKGERGTTVLFYSDLPADGSDTVTPPDDAPHFVARASTVFNVAQVDAPPDPVAPLPKANCPEPLPVLTTFVAATGVTIVEGGTRACYVPATDTIRLPPLDRFMSAAGYAGTLSHELIHWTGAPQRLHRDLTGRFGTHAYAAEELVAELGAAFILADLGLAREPHPDHAAYVAHWLPLLRADPRALVAAAGHASRAAAYLADLQPGAGCDAVEAGGSAAPVEADAAGADAPAHIRAAA